MYDYGHLVSGKTFICSRYHYIVGTSITLGVGADLVEIYEKLELPLKEVEFFKEAPFRCISGSTIFQLRNIVDFGAMIHGRISKKYMDTGVSIYPDYRIFHAADALSREILLDFYKILSLEEIIAVGKKYKLPISVFEEMLSKMGRIPKWTEEMGDLILDSEREGSQQCWNDNWMKKPEIVIDLYKSSVGVDVSNDDRYLKFFVTTNRKKKT